jgi:hypothetical protein
MSSGAHRNAATLEEVRMPVAKKPGAKKAVKSKPRLKSDMKKKATKKPTKKK